MLKITVFRNKVQIFFPNKDDKLSLIRYELVARIGREFSEHSDCFH